MQHILHSTTSSSNVNIGVFDILNNPSTPARLFMFATRKFTTNFITIFLLTSLIASTPIEPTNAIGIAKHIPGLPREYSAIFSGGYRRLINFVAVFEGFLMPTQAQV